MLAGLYRRVTGRLLYEAGQRKDGRENWHQKIVKDGRENWHKKIVKDCRENWHKKIVKDCRENWRKKIVKDCRENWHKKIVKDCRENWHKKIVKGCPENWHHRERLPIKLAHEHRERLPRKLEEHHDALPRPVAKFDARSPGRQSKHWAHEHFDGLFGKLKGYRVNLMGERAELRERFPGKIDKVVTQEQKQVEKVVTHEEKEVEKIVKGFRAELMMFCGGINLMSQHVDLTCVSQTWQSNSILSCTTCTNFVASLTVDLSVKPGSSTMNMFVLSLLSKLSVTVDTHTRSTLVCLKFFVDIHKSFSRFFFFLCREHVAHSVFSHDCVVQNIGFDSFIDDLSSVDRSVV